MGKTEWFRSNPYCSPGPCFCEDQELLLRTHRAARFAVLPASLLAYRVQGPILSQKLIRTRATLAALQLRYFLSHGETKSALKAIAFFIAKCVHDSTAGWAGRLARSAYAGVSLIDMTKEEFVRWEQTLPQLYAETVNCGVPSESGAPDHKKSRLQEKDDYGEQQHFNSSLHPLTFWLLAFIFCCLQALMVQKLLLPLIPSLHAGHGLMINDAIIFHNVASAAADRIRSIGWSQWTLFPPGFSGNVGILSALYVLFGPEPAVFIPLNAAAHVTGALMLYLMGPLLWPGRVGRIGGLVTAILFVIFPSTLLWYSQNHKDAFTIAGTLMILYAWLRIIAPHEGSNIKWSYLLLAVSGAALVIIFRPYLTFLVAGGFISSFLAVLIQGYFIKSPICRFRLSLEMGILIVIIFSAALIGKLMPASENAMKADFAGVVNSSERAMKADFSSLISSSGEFVWKWKPLYFSPKKDHPILKILESPFRRISEIRAYFIAYGQSVGASSGIDEDHAPDNILASISYFPRAFVVGSLSPFPSSWTQRVSVPRLTAAGETFLWYCFALGLTALVFRRPSAVLIGGLVFSIFIISIYSYTSPNIGTLYRMRFGCWMFFLLAGCVGWTSLILPFLSRLSATANKTSLTLAAEVNQNKASSGISGLATAGSVALAITFVGFLGFLARDLLLINLRGMVGALDAFFAAVMLPMVFVTCLIMPIADVITKPFLENYHRWKGLEQSNDIVARFLGVGMIVAVSAMAVTYFVAPQAIGMLTSSQNKEVILQGTHYLRLFSPIIILSVWTVLGNSVLNSLGKSSYTASAQLIVPVCAVLGILLAKPEYTLLGGICGMLVGTLLNAVIVLVLCSGQGIRLIPAWSGSALPEGCFRSYNLLALATVSTALLVPLNYFFASNVGEGFVSSWAFSSKIITIFNGLFAFVVTSVVLPHLAHTFERHNNSGGRNHLYFLLMAGSWIGGFIALVLAIFAEPLIYALLSTSDKISDEQIHMLAQVLRLGALQVPVAITGAIAFKSAAVSGVTAHVMLSSFVGLAINLIVDLLLVPHYGLEGIALGALAALMVSTLLLCVTLRSSYGMSLMLSGVILVGWIVWAAATWAIEVHSSAGIMLVGVAVVLLFLLQWIFWSKKLHHRCSLRVGSTSP
jgi:peptidoglycan biosynthesis protein MviN/MurJ (putative lipid II flippase)